MGGTHIPNCSVCFEELGKYGGPTSLPCGHNGCLQCFAHIQRARQQPQCPICRSPFPPSLQLVVNYELRDLMQLATALTSVDRDDDGWQAVTSAKLHGTDGGKCADGYGGCEEHAVALVPSAPPLHVDLRAVLEGSGDLMSLEPPKWVPDSSSPDCTACARPFSFLLRSRHHCRVCGDLFCDACSSGRMLLPPRFLQTEPQRCCAPCAELLAPLQPLLAGTVSRAVQAPIHDTTDWSVWRSLLNSPLSSRLEDDIFKAVNIVRHFAGVGALRPERGIPQAVLAGCAGLAVLSVLKVGAGWSAGVGTGVVVARRAGGGWSAPSSVLSVSAGAGWQLGAELVDVVVVLRNSAAVRAFCGAQLGVGGSLSIAAGPLGREAAAKVQVGAGGGALCYSYSVSRGAYVGVGLEGTLLRSRDAVNHMFYGRRLPARALLLSETLQPPVAAATLYDALDDLLLRAGVLGAGGAQFSVRAGEAPPLALEWEAGSGEVEGEEHLAGGAPPQLAVPPGSAAVYQHSVSARSGSDTGPVGIPASPPRRGRERERAGGAGCGGGISYPEVAGAMPLWHAQSAPSYSAWDDGQALPSLFD